MKTSFKVELLKFITIQELPNAWNNQKYQGLLDFMDYKNTFELALEDMKEMCLNFLMVKEPEEAAKIVLDYTLNNKLNKGQILNISNEMLAEKIWEEYPDLSLHEELFNVNHLLHKAFNGQFPYPEAVRFQVSIKAKEKNGTSIFDNYPEATLIRLLVSAMPAENLIFRLFEEQVVGKIFKDAKDIIWQLRTKKINGNEMIFDIISSSYWFQDFEFVDAFEAETHGDLI